jgi:murein DD-endopeptidase MepM/ murein hydrolase activator NlpD
MRRLVFGLAVLGLLLAGVPALQAAPLEDARRRQRALAADLQAATAELQAAEAALAKATDQLAYDKGQLEAADRRASGARAALAGQAAAMYRSGGLAIADALLDQDPALVPARVELATVLVSHNAQLIEDAQVAGDAYRSVLGRVARGHQQARILRDQARAAVGKLAAGLAEAKAVEARLVRLEQRRRAAAKVAPGPGPAPGLAGSGSASGSSCILERPYSYVDSWGAARSGGRSHKGTDVMAPNGARVFAIVNGVVSRESSSTNGGIQLYLQGDNGIEYFYAHLSGYAVSTGTRVRAGQLVAYSGQTGNARYTAPHVHFEVHPGGGTPVNPYPYLRRVCP